MNVTNVLELIAIFFGFISIYFSAREKIWVYPLGLVNTILYIYLSFSAGLYGEGSLNFYYTILSFWGWYNWSKTKNHKPIQISHLKKKQWIKIIIFILILCISLYFFLISFTDSAVPIWDSITTSIAFVAMFLMIKKIIQHWIFWIVSNTIAIPLFFYQGLRLTSIQFVVYALLAIWGYVSWSKKYNASVKSKIIYEPKH